MGFTAYLKTILSDLLRGPQPNKNQHAQRHGNKASGRNGSRKGSHQHKTMLTRKGQHQGTTTPRTTQEKRNHRYLPPNPPNPPPNSPRPRPIRLPQNPPPAPPPSPRPRPIRLGVEPGEPQANNTAQVEVNQKSIPIWPASAPAASLPPPVALSSIFEAFDRDGARDNYLHQRPGLPLDTVTLAAWEEGLQAPVPPALLPVRMASPAFSCASASSEDTIALIDYEIESWHGTRSSRRRSIKRVCVPPPWKSGWNESFVRQREYPDWI
ncbi:hypothetical protein GE21DRAFT_1342806 [Neurospora crassa]|nr:hypothetical protein GE21DRAFT_1342806 [Neurospora crassa]